MKTTTGRLEILNFTASVVFERKIEIIEGRKGWFVKLNATDKMTSDEAERLGSNIRTAAEIADWLTWNDVRIEDGKTDGMTLGNISIETEEKIIDMIKSGNISEAMETIFEKTLDEVEGTETYETRITIKNESTGEIETRAGDTTHARGYIEAMVYITEEKAERLYHTRGVTIIDAVNEIGYIHYTKDGETYTMEITIRKAESEKTEKTETEAVA